MTSAHTFGRLGLGAAAAALLTRVAFLGGPAYTLADEGGYPLSVARLAREGLVTFDFHTTPLYHLVLGSVFWFFPPTLVTGRVVSVLLGLVSIALLWRFVRGLTDSPEVAAWSAILWASCFPAADLGSRALIEPFQLVWLLSLLVALVGTGRRAGPLAAVATAGLLLTKANAIGMLPALVVALWWDSAPSIGAQRRDKAIGIGAGVLLAAFGFAVLYALDPETFARGWGPTLAKPMNVTDTQLVRVGRFALDPALLADRVSYLASNTPFLIAFGTTGAVWLVWRRRGAIIGLALATYLPFLLAQSVVSIQYFALIYPLLAGAAAVLLCSAWSQDAVRPPWPAIALLLAIADGCVRSLASVVVLPTPERAGVEWLRREIRAEARVVAAPYILVQLDARRTSLFDLVPEDGSPDAAALCAGQFDVVVIDSYEWQPRLSRMGISADAFDADLQRCLRPVYRDGHLRILRSPALTPPQGGAP